LVLVGRLREVSVLWDGVEIVLERNILLLLRWSKVLLLFGRIPLCLLRLIGGGDSSVEESVGLLIGLLRWECGFILVLSGSSGSAAGAFAMGLLVGREE